MEWSLVVPSSGRAVPFGGPVQTEGEGGGASPEGERAPEAPGWGGAERGEGRGAPRSLNETGITFS